MNDFITENNKAVHDIRNEHCPHCSEPFGSRKVRTAEDVNHNQTIVHSRCYDGFRTSVHDERRAKQLAKQEAKRQEREATRKTNQERRGTDAKEWVRSMDVVPEEETHLWTILYHAVHDVKSRDEAVEKLKSRLDENPDYALEWALSTFEAVARGKVADQVIHGFASGCTQEEVVSTLERETLRRAKWPERSTSPTSCLMSQEITAAYARLLDQN